MEESKRLDNQQETKFPYELGWLVGIIDGEGTIGLYPSGNYKGGKQYKPAIQISNTEYEIIERAIECCEKLGIAHFVREEKPRIPRRGKYVYRPCFYLKVSGYKRIKRFFEVIKPEYFTGKKKKQAEIVYKFVKSRLGRKRGWQNKKWGYSDYEIGLFEKSKEINRRGKGKRILTDYTPGTDN